MLYMHPHFWVLKVRAAKMTDKGSFALGPFAAICTDKFPFHTPTFTKFQAIYCPLMMGE